MANPLDTDAGSELFSSYEAELKLVQADLSQKLDQIPELSGEPRKSAISQAERALEEANEIVSIPSPILTFPVRHTSCCW
jgi:vesicle transport through interaction with t-SNAREs protein 1